MDRVITFGFTENFIERTADLLAEKYPGRDFGRVACVFGGRRPALFLKRALAARVGESFFPPAFFSMDEFMTEVAARHAPRLPMPGIDAAYLVYTIAGEVAPQVTRGRESFSRFLPWAGEIVSFIDHADLEMIPDADLVNVQHNAAIGYDVPESINTLLKHISEIRTAYHAALEKAGRLTHGLAYTLAARHVDATEFEEFDEILFCNFYYLHRTERAVMKSLYTRGRARLLFQSDRQGERKDWTVLEELGRHFGAEIKPATAARASYDLKLYTGYDTHSQAAVVREIVKTIPDPSQAVLVVPEPDAVIPVLTEVAPLVEDLNVSLGYPLRRSSLYSLMEYIFTAQNTRRTEGYYARDYLKALSHPLVKNLKLPYDPAVTRVLVHKMEELLLGTIESPVGGSVFVNPDDVAAVDALYESARETLLRMDHFAKPEELRAIVDNLHRLLFRAWEGATDFKSFCGVLVELLDTLMNKSFLPSYPLNVKAVERLYDIADELKHASFAHEPFSPDELFRIALERFKKEMISFAGSPLKGFQVLGLMEARSLNFEHVIVMDLNESVLPKLRVNEPLIPREVMLSLGLNRLEKEEEIQRYQFMRLISAARNVHLVYSEDKQKEKSRFIEELAWARQKEKKSLDALPLSRARFDVKILTGKAPAPKSDETAAWLKTQKYSASRVNTYLDCPMRFHFQYVLGLREKDDLLDEPDAAEIGTFLHDLLFEAYSPFKGKRPVIDAVFRNSFFDRFETLFTGSFAKKMKSDAFLVREIVLHRLRGFLDAEAARPVAEIVALEEKYPGTVKAGDTEFAFEARVDRIDRLEDGSLLIIDYKSGSSAVMPKGLKSLSGMKLERPSIRDTVCSFQLPLYAHIVGGHFPGARLNAAAYSLRDASLSLFYKDKEADDESREQKAGLCRAGLEHILTEIVDPGVPFIPDDADRDRCFECPFFYACR